MIASVVVALALLLGAPAPAAPLTIDAAYRSLAPGELVVLTIKIDGAPTSVRVNAFRRVIPAFKTEDGSWRALVGIDLDQRPGCHLVEAEATVERPSCGNAGAGGDIAKISDENT
jgi:hypothetical protein